MALLLSGQSAIFAATDQSIETVQGDIADKQNQISDLKDQEKALLSELVALESQLHTTRDELNQLNQKLDAAKFELNQISLSKESVQEDLKKKKKILESRLANIYTGSRFISLDFILSSKDIATLISRLAYLNLIVKQDAKLVQKVESEKQYLEEAQIRIEQENRSLLELQANCSAKQSELDKKFQEKESVLENVKSQQLETEESLNDMQNRAIQIRTKMNELQPPSRGVTRGNLRLLATGYCPCSQCCGKNSGTTASGLPAGKGVVAVDPSVIPLGTKLYISEYGEAIAADVGGNIKGNRIDLGFDSHSQALAWGKRWVVVDILQ